MKTIKPVILLSVTLCILFSLDGKTTYKIDYKKCSATTCSPSIKPTVGDTIRLSLPKAPSNSDWKFAHVNGFTSPYRYAPTKSEISIYEKPVAYFDVRDGSDTASFTVQQRDSANNAVLDEKTFTFKIKRSKK